MECAWCSKLFEPDEDSLLVCQDCERAAAFGRAQEKKRPSVDMQRRERIAMAAMQGILSDRSGHGRHESFHIREVAGAALVVADELIALLDAAADKDGGS